MALQLSFTDACGVTHSAAYARATTSQDGTKGSANLKIFHDKAARDAGMHPVSGMGFSFTFDPASSDNIIKQAYDFMKTRTELDGAVDV